jgi:hypothetical protein
MNVLYDFVPWYNLGMSIGLHSNGATLRNCVIVAAIGLIQACSVASLADFTKCIGPQGMGAVCQLDTGTYPLSTQLQIGRSNITIKGTILTSPSDTILQRAPGWHYSLLIDVGPPSTATPVANITVRDMTFDGNRSQNTDVWSSYFAELMINTTKSLLVTNCDFINSPAISFVVEGRGASGVVVNNSYFANAVIYGFWAGATGSNMLEAPNGFELCPTLVIPDDIVVANSSFENGGESVITLDATNVQITNNIFRNNKSDTVPFNDSGGQIDLSVCTANGAVVGNTFENAPLGSNGQPGGGIELHGTDLTIVNNLIINNAGPGVATAGVQRVFLANWNQATTTSRNNGGGVALYHPSGWRADDSITIDTSNITDNGGYGVWIYTDDIPITNVTLTNNCLAGNTYGPTYFNGLGTGALIQGNAVAGCEPG